jgi:hypothetical protein
MQHKMVKSRIFSTLVWSYVRESSL